jgi:hypothetical protein
MSSTAVLEKDVTTTVLAQEVLAPTVESAFRAAHISIMSPETRRKLRWQAEREAYRFEMGVYPVHRHQARSRGMRWYFGPYNVHAQTFEALDPRGTGRIVYLDADPICAAITKNLNRELAKVSGIEYSFEIESYGFDPIASVVITVLTTSVTKKYRYFAWDGDRTTWPPSRG